MQYCDTKLLLKVLIGANNTYALGGGSRRRVFVRQWKYMPNTNLVGLKPTRIASGVTSMIKAMGYTSKAVCSRNGSTLYPQKTQ